ncbi:MAG: TonB-dependent receptor [Gemmatimonadota bacterium]
MTKMRMRQVLMVLFLFLPPALTAPLAAQDEPVIRRGTGTILGTVLAGDTGEPLASIAVELLFAADSAAIAQTLTNAEGAFRFSLVAEGDYLLRIVSIGYGTVMTERFELADDEMRNLGDLRLPVEAVTLDAIEVSSERTAVTFEADRTSYNMGVMPGTEGATVTETFQSIPELEVDINGQVTLRGSTPAIYINGRRAPMTGEALTIFLEQFPADYLTKIEVIDNPSARYDAEGSGGIINLVMKEGVELGMSGSVFANAGTRGQYGAGGRGTMQRGDWTLNGGGFLRLSDSESSNYNLRQNLLADPAFLRQDSWSDRSGLSSNADMEIRFEPREDMQISLEGSLSGSGNDSDGLTTTTHLDELQEQLLIYDRLRASDSRNLSGDVALAFEYETESDREFQAELQYSRGSQHGDSRDEITMQSEFDDDSALIPAELTIEDEDESEHEVSLGADYTHPWGEDGRIELGFQSELQTSDNARLIRLIDDPQGAPDGLLTDRGFDQQQVTSAVYTTLQRQFGDFGVQVGLRAEQFDLDFELPGGESFEREYTNLFPSANVSYRLESGQQIRLSYSRRIGQPGASVLNPTNLSTDPLNRRVGNPDIEPQFTHSFTMNASWSGSLGNLRLSPYYRKTTNDWAQLTTVDENGISTQTYENLVSQQSYGASLTYSLRQRDGWGGNISLSGARNIRDASNLGERYSGSSLRWSSRANLSARVTEALSAEGNFGYTPPSDMPQGRSDAQYRGDVGLRYRMLDGRGSLRLSIQDPFGLRKTSSRMQDVAYIMIGRSQESTRSAQLSVSYTLGGGGRMRRGGGGGGDGVGRGGDR